MSTAASVPRSRNRFPNRRTRAGRAQRLSGLFADGIWLCDCQPQRLPASHFKVKKECANQGRWFFTCQRDADKRCGFFLWNEDAKLREESAVLGNSRTETGKAGRVENKVERWDGSAEERPAKRVERNEASPSRNGRAWRGDNGEDVQLEAAMARVASRMDTTARLPETPKKYHTASTKITGGLATPSTSTATGPNTSSKRKFVDLTEPADLPPAPTTPTPIRRADFIAAPAAPPSPSSPELLTSLLATLSQHSIKPSPALQSDLSALCAKATNKLRGVEKGREIARLALKAKDARVAELGLRIETLHAELEMERAMVRALREGADVGNGVR